MRKFKDRYGVFGHEIGPRYRKVCTRLRGLLSPGPGTRAIQHAGEAATRDAILKDLAPFKTAAGGYLIKNKTRYMIVKT
jgi:hypothetical protein